MFTGFDLLGKKLRSGSGDLGHISGQRIWFCCVKFTKRKQNFVNFIIDIAANYTEINHN